MNIAGLLKTATIDFPHRLAAVVFTAGCNYDCGFCHNRELLTTKKLMDEKEAWRFLEKRAGLLDGIVISGGEPTLQEDLPEFAQRLKELGYDVKLDTNGSAPQVVEEMLRRGCVDYVAMDYKAPFELYTQVCGHDASGVEQTLELLRGATVEWELRTTVIPELSEKDLLRMAQGVEELPAYALQLYRPVRVERKKVYSAQDIVNFAEKLRQYQKNIFPRC